MTKNSQDNLQIKLIKKLILLLLIIFIMPSIHCQDTSEKQKNSAMDYKYGTSIKLNIKEEVKFKDGLSMFLESFSHKHPFVGGPTKATANITLSKDKISEYQSLSIRGTEGEPDVEYDSLLWNGYVFKLIKFEYDTFIEIIITKNK